MVEDKKIERAAIYCRVSTEDQAKEGFSLAAQRDRLRKYCEAQGWTVIEIYTDDGFTGRDIKRPAYQRMISETNRWDAIVVLKMDRIHRNSRNFLDMMDKLQRAGKDFVSMMESFDTHTAMGRFFMKLLQNVAELESEQLGERTKMGMEQKVKQAAERGAPAILGSNTPYGYRWVGELGEKHLEIIQDEAVTVRMMFRLAQRGKTLRQIVKKLHSEKITTKRGGTWSFKVVRRILRNPLYAGYAGWDGLIYRGQHKPIVEPRTFNAVQRALHHRARSRKVQPVTVEA